MKRVEGEEERRLKMGECSEKHWTVLPLLMMENACSGNRLDIMFRHFLGLRSSSGVGEQARVHGLVAKLSMIWQLCQGGKR